MPPRQAAGVAPHVLGGPGPSPGGHPTPRSSADSPRTFFSASSLPGGRRAGPRCPGPRPHRGCRIPGRPGPKGRGARRPPGSWAQGPGGRPSRRSLREGGGGGDGGAAAGAAAAVLVVLVASPRLAHAASSAVPQAPRWRLVGWRGWGRGGRGLALPEAGLGGGNRGGRRLALLGCALAPGLRARSYCPKNGPARVLLGGARAREGLGGVGSGVGASTSLAFKGAAALFPALAARAGMGRREGKQGCAGAWPAAQVFRAARAAAPLGWSRGRRAPLPRHVFQEGHTGASKRRGASLSKCTLLSPF